MTEQNKPDLDQDRAVKALTEVLGTVPVEQIPAVKEILNKYGLGDIAVDMALLRDTLYPETLAAWINTLQKADRSSQEFRYQRRKIIHQVCKSFGYTVKEGEKDFKEYVYKAAEALLDRVERHYRTVGALAVYNAGDMEHKTIEKYEAMEDRSRWDLKTWIEHLGGRQEEDQTITFGSWMAVGQLLHLYTQEAIRAAVLNASKPKQIRQAAVVKGTEAVREKLGQLLAGRVLSLNEYDASLAAIVNEAGVTETDNWAVEVRPVASGQVFVSLSVNGRFIWGANDTTLQEE